MAAHAAIKGRDDAAGNMIKTVSRRLFLIEMTGQAVSRVSGCGNNVGNRPRRHLTVAQIVNHLPVCPMAHGAIVGPVHGKDLAPVVEDRCARIRAVFPVADVAGLVDGLTAVSSRIVLEEVRRLMLEGLIVAIDAGVKSAMTSCRTDQCAIQAVTSAAIMMLGVVRNRGRHSRGGTCGAGMTRGARIAHGDPGGVVKTTVFADKDAVTVIAIGSATVASGQAGQGPGVVMTVGTALMLLGLGDDSHTRGRTLSTGMASRAISGHGHRQRMVLSSMLHSKEAMTGLTVIIIGLAGCRTVHSAGRTMATGAGAMGLGVGAIDHNPARRAIHPGMTSRTGL